MLCYPSFLKKIDVVYTLLKIQNEITENNRTFSADNLKSPGSIKNLPAFCKQENYLLFISSIRPFLRDLPFNLIDFAKYTFQFLKIKCSQRHSLMRLVKGSSNLLNTLFNTTLSHYTRLRP